MQKMHVVLSKDNHLKAVHITFHQKIEIRKNCSFLINKNKILFFQIFTLNDGIANKTICFLTSKFPHE